VSCVDWVTALLTDICFDLWLGTASRHFNLDDAIRFKTSGDSWFLKRFFHTKLGDFTGKEGGEVSILAGSSI